MNTHRAIIDLWPNLQKFAEDIGVKYGTAQVMRHRNSIPSEYWLSATEGAKRRGIKGVSLEVLAKIRARSRRAA